MTLREVALLMEFHRPHEKGLDYAGGMTLEMVEELMAME